MEKAAAAFCVARSLNGISAIGPKDADEALEIVRLFGRGSITSMAASKSYHQPKAPHQDLPQKPIISIVRSVTNWQFAFLTLDDSALREVLPMDMRSNVPAIFGPSDLARVPPFAVGALKVDPPTRAIVNGTRRATLEPRVMQVLVALGHEPGVVLSRDDLIALAWDGRIVGDNAINRVISLLRQALLQVAGDAVTLETITKVGFRLVATAANPVSDRDDFTKDPALLSDRRKLLLGGSALFGAATLSGWTILRKAQPDPKAVELTREADLLMKSGLPGSTRQATRNLERAVKLDPDYADGWGYLALMYRHAMNGFAGGERRNLALMMNSAASRALALDPEQADAHLAKAIERPFYRNWSESEKSLRTVVREHPGHWYANAQLALLLVDVGRATEALEFREKVMRIDPKIPVAWSLLALNRLQANRLHEADLALEHAFGQWPNHPALWGTRYRVLLETGRPIEAAQFIRIKASRPDGVPDRLVEDAAADAEAIADGGKGLRAAAIARARESLSVPEAAEDAAPMLAMLGEPELAMEVASAYFLGGSVEGKSWPIPDASTARSTAMLFYPSFLQLAGRPGFHALLDRAGLTEYWSVSGSQPDFRRS